MRISDWRSDVCSSDLSPAGRPRADRARDHDRRDRTIELQYPALDPPYRLGDGARSSPYGADRGRVFGHATRLRGRRRCPLRGAVSRAARSEEHTSELQSLMRISYAVFCLKKKTTHHIITAY